jgi:hypothetical protein
MGLVEVWVLSLKTEYARWAGNGQAGQEGGWLKDRKTMRLTHVSKSHGIADTCF